MDAALKKLRKAGSAYVKMLGSCLKTEESGKGLKGGSAIYHDLEILRLNLQGVSKIPRQGVAHTCAWRDSVDKSAETDILEDLKMTCMSLKILGQSIYSEGERSLAYAQVILENPTPEQFNSLINDAARNLTQHLFDIRNWTMPRRISEAGQSKRMEAMQDRAIYRIVGNLYHLAERCKGDVLPLIARTGSTPLDANLSRMASDPPRFDETASQEDVIKATEHFIRQVKMAMEIGSALKD